MSVEIPFPLSPRMLAHIRQLQKDVLGVDMDETDGPDLSERIDPRDVAAARSAGRIRAWKEVDVRGDDETEPDRS